MFSTDRRAKCELNFYTEPVRVAPVCVMPVCVCVCEVDLLPFLPFFLSPGMMTTALGTDLFADAQRCGLETR